MRKLVEVRTALRIAIVLSPVFAPALRAQSPSVDEIVSRMMERNAERQAMLQHYATNRMYRLEYNGTGGEHHAEMVVHAEYDAPGHKQLTIVSQSGSKVLCHEVLRRLVDSEEETAARNRWQQEMLSPETYNFQLIGKETLDGVSAWVLAVQPKKPSKVAYEGRIWVSTTDYAVMRIQGSPAKNPSWLMNHATFDTWYMRRGKVWVPEKNVSKTHIRFGGEAVVTIDYGDYPVLTTTPISAAVSPDTTPDAPASPSPSMTPVAKSFR